MKLVPETNNACYFLSLFRTFEGTRLRKIKGEATEIKRLSPLN